MRGRQATSALTTKSDNENGHRLVSRMRRVASRAMRPLQWTWLGLELRIGWRLPGTGRMSRLRWDRRAVENTAGALRALSEWPVLLIARTHEDVRPLPH